MKIMKLNFANKAGATQINDRTRHQSKSIKMSEFINNIAIEPLFLSLSSLSLIPCAREFHVQRRNSAAHYAPYHTIKGSRLNE